MTRINVVPVETLTDQHLLAEYKEITRPFNKMIKRIKKGKLDINPPSSYVLGEGHETFFFDKLRWLWNRYFDIYLELENREYNLDQEKFGEISDIFFDVFSGTQFWNDYEPTPEEIYINMARLCHSHFKDTIMEYKA